MHGGDPAERMSRQYRLALILVLVGSVVNSTNGLILRSLRSADDWQAVCIRSGSLAIGICIVYVMRNRGRIRQQLRTLDRWSLLGALPMAGANTGFIWSMSHTTVANTTFVLSATPIFTGLMAWLVLGERVSTAAWVAMGVALGGILVMLYDGLGSGTFFGNGLAVLTALCFSTFIVVLRKGRSTDMLPVLVLGSSLAAVSALLMADFQIAVELHDLGLLVLWGGALSCLVHVLFTFSSRYILGAELSLLVLLEFILAPTWVWLAYAEQPSSTTLGGGALVLLAVGGLAFARLMGERATR